MKIYDKNDVEIYDIAVDDTSVRYRSIMNDDSLTLNFSLTGTVSIPQFSYCDFEGTRYFLLRPQEFKKHNSRNHEYTLTMHGYREFLKFVKYKDISTTPFRLKFSLTAKPEIFMQNLVECLNANNTGGGWTVGDCLDAPEKTLSFNHEYCLDALARFAQEWETEYEFENKKIHLRKVEKFKDEPLELSYGKGNGFLPGVGRYNEGDKQPVGKLFVQGGERNIDFSTYNSKSLLLPKLATLDVDGKSYITDADGMFITRVGGINTAEDSYDGSDIYPKRIGTVSEVVVVDEDKHFYDVIDSSIPESLDYGDCRIAGEKAVIKFESGALAGREFDIEQTDSDLTGYIHSERRFKIVPAELDGYVMPGGVFVPAIGDKYAIFNINMPDAYICDNETQTGASWDLFREGVRYFAEYENERFKFTGELDGIWSKSRWLEIGGKIVPGGHVLFSDEQFQQSGVVIRIVSIKDYINNPHMPEITLSNAPVSSSFSSTIGNLEAQEVVIENNYLNAINFAKRQWRDVKETTELLEQSFLNFGNSINPMTVYAMQLVAGDESLQFRFVNNIGSGNVVNLSIVYNVASKKLNVAAGILQHMTIGINTITTIHNTQDYKHWSLGTYISPALVDSEKPYYLYAKCLKNGTSGVFLLSETAIKMEAVTGYYHFLVGILNSEADGDRSFIRLYGYTEILPGRITTDRIVSSNGSTYFDLINNVIGGNIQFNSTEGVQTDLAVWAQETTQSITSARLLVLSSTSQIMPCNADNQPLSGQVITFTAKLQHLTGVASFNAVAHTATGTHTLQLGGSGNTRTLTSSQWATTYIKVVVTASLGGQSDTVTVYRNNEGAVGAAGQGIDNVTEQFYLSTSKTQLQGGSWLDTPPAWEQGKWMWTRAKIIYTNPYSVSYTTPVCDTTWEIVNEITIGTGNLLRNTDFTRNLSGVQMLGAYNNVSVDAQGRLLIAHPTATTIRFRFTTQLRLEANKTYFFAVDEWWRELATIGINTGQAIYSFTRVKAETVQPDNGTRVYYKITPASTINGRIEVSSSPNQQDVRIKRPMLECATHPSDYAPAYEDTQDYINEVNAMALQSVAVTQGFTAINGGLIATVMMLLREANSSTTTAGISGQQKLQGGLYGYAPSFWSGGTLEQATAFSALMQKIDAGTLVASDWNVQLPTTVMLHNGHAKVGDYIISGTTGEISMYGGSADNRFLIRNSAITAFETATSGTSDSGVAYNSAWQSTSPQTYQLPQTLNVRVNGSKIRFQATIRVSNQISNNTTQIQGAGVRVELYRGTTFIATLGSVGVVDGVQELALNVTVNNVTRGIHNIKFIYERGQANTGYGYISYSTFSWEFVAGSIKRTEFGTNGFMSVNADGHVYFSERFRLDVKGATNVPGVLLSASVPVAGGFSHSWGAKRHTALAAEQVSGYLGRYRVYHSIGHTYYHITATPHTANRSCHIISRNPDNFVIEWRTIGSSPQPVNTAFDFQITGDNYTPRAGRDERE